MFPIYLFCLIVGGALILVSLLGHGDHDSSADLDADAAAMDLGHGDLGDVAAGDGGMDGLDHDGLGEVGQADAAHDAGGDSGDGSIGAAHHPELADLTRFFSLRNMTFAMAFFGLTGVIGERLVVAAGYVVVPSAVSVGLIAWIVTHRAFQILRNEQPTSGLDARDFDGVPAEVLVPIEEGRLGSVRVTLKGKQVQLRARPAPGQDRANFACSESVVVVELKDGVAEIVQA